MLIVEDLPEKAEEISLEIIANFPNIKITRKTSYHSAIEEIFKNHKEYFLILLDLSLIHI